MTTSKGLRDRLQQPVPFCPVHRTPMKLARIVAASWYRARGRDEEKPRSGLTYDWRCRERACKWRGWESVEKPNDPEDSDFWCPHGNSAYDYIPKGGIGGIGRQLADGSTLYSEDGGRTWVPMETKKD